jgi:hypothetical protein
MAANPAQLVPPVAQQPQPPVAQQPQPPVAQQPYPQQRRRTARPPTVQYSSAEVQNLYVRNLDPSSSYHYFITT